MSEWEKMQQGITYNDFDQDLFSSCLYDILNH